MDQKFTTSPAIRGAGFMIAAGVAFAIVNTVTPIITWQMGVPSSSVVFWQYVIASIAFLPLILRIGLGHLKTRHPLLHEARALLSALGVQAFAFGFASGVPVWQMVTLTMTGPFFIIAGSILFLGERPGATRLTTALIGFSGAILVSGIGTEGFTWFALLPVFAAFLWGTVSVLTKYLTREESAESLTLYMLVLITPNHLLIALVLGGLVAAFPTLIPASLASGFDFALPNGDALGLILLLGLVTAASQYFFSLAYASADATYLQPFDDLKLPLNTLMGWLVLGQVPSTLFWIGAALIFGASGYLYWSERRGEKWQSATTNI